MTLSYKDVAEIIKIIDASACEEVILELADVKIVVRRGAGTASTPGAVAALVAPAVVPVVAAPRAEPIAAPVVKPGELAPGTVLVRAPMTGTFYRAPSPQEPPFVEVGRVVKVGDVLCSIEVMKLFTTITAEVAGKITRIFAENGALVQFDQHLFAIET